MEPCQSSGLKAASAAICTRPCIYYGMSVSADGTNSATAIVYDHISAASGTVIDKVIVDATATHENCLHSVGVVCSNGLYLSLAGDGTEEAVVYFKPI